MRTAELNRLGLCAAARLRIARAAQANRLAERADFEIMRARTRASRRGATPVEVQRSVAALWGAA